MRCDEKGTRGWGVGIAVFMTYQRPPLALYKHRHTHSSLPRTHQRPSLTHHGYGPRGRVQPECLQDAAGEEGKSGEGIAGEGGAAEGLGERRGERRG